MSERSSRRSAHVATVTAFTEKCARFDSLERYSAGEFASPSAAASGQIHAFGQGSVSRWLCWRYSCRGTRRRKRRLARKAPRANQTGCSNGWCRRPISATPAHAVLFRPPGDGPFPLALIAHASTQNVLRRAQMPQPEYRALAALLVARGFAVLVPERLGPWRHRRKISGGPRRLRRSGLFARRPRHRRRDRRRHGFPAPATLHPAATAR